MKTPKIETMQAAVVAEAGGLPEYRDFPTPRPEKDEVLVHMHAAGLHQLVRAIASGAHIASERTHPFVVGVDGVGRLDDGTRVYCGLPRAPFGTMAEWTAVPRTLCFPMPLAATNEAVAAIMNPAMSSWIALRCRAQMQPGAHVLVLGATGVAGRLAIQIARKLGAGRVVAAGRNRSALDTCGADAVIDIAQPPVVLRDELARETVDIVLDYLWGAPAAAVLATWTAERSGHSALVAKGSVPVRWIEVGEMAGASLAIPAALLRATDITFCGSGGGSVPVARYIEAIPELLGWIARGELHARVDPRPLSGVGDAWREQRAGHRIVLCTNA